MSQWYYTKDGNQNGPVSSEQLRRLIASGTLLLTESVWREGMADWVPVASVRGLTATTAGAAQSHALVEGGSAPLAYATPVAQATPVAPLGGGVRATGRSLDLLRQTKPWVRLISVVMLICAGLMVVLGLLQLAMAGGSGPDEVRIIQTIVVVVLAVVYAVLAWLLSQYATGIARLLKTQRDCDLEVALQAQRSFWVVSGILTLAVLILYAVLFLILLVSGTSTLFR